MSDSRKEPNPASPEEIELVELHPSTPEKNSKEKTQTTGYTQVPSSPSSSNSGSDTNTESEEEETAPQADINQELQKKLDELQKKLAELQQKTPAELQQKLQALQDIKKELEEITKQQPPSNDVNALQALEKQCANLIEQLHKQQQVIKLQAALAALQKPPAASTQEGATPPDEESMGLSSERPAPSATPSHKLKTPDYEQLQYNRLYGKTFFQVRNRTNDITFSDVDATQGMTITIPSRSSPSTQTQVQLTVLESFYLREMLLTPNITKAAPEAADYYGPQQDAQLKTLLNTPQGLFAIKYFEHKHKIDAIQSALDQVQAPPLTEEQSKEKQKELEQYKLEFTLFLERAKKELEATRRYQAQLEQNDKTLAIIQTCSHLLKWINHTLHPDEEFKIGPESISQARTDLQYAYTTTAYKAQYTAKAVY